MTDGAVLAAALVAALAGLARGFSGFGAALIFIPLGSALASAKGSSVAPATTRKELARSRVRPLAATSGQASSGENTRWRGN